MWVSKCSFPSPRKQRAWGLELANLNGSSCVSLEHATYFPMVCFLIYWMRIMMPSHTVKVGRKIKVHVYARACGELAGAMQVTGLFRVTFVQSGMILSSRPQPLDLLSSFIFEVSYPENYRILVP